MPSRVTRNEKQRASVSTSTSALASPDSASAVDDYETPETSAAATPALSVTASKRRRQAPSSLKIQMFEATDGDAEMAQVLQEEEYNLDDARKGKKSVSTHTTKNIIALSDSDDESALSEPIEISSDDEPMFKKRKLSTKITQTKSRGNGKGKALRTTAPKRPARSSAQKAMKKFKFDEAKTVADSQDYSSFSEDDESELEFFDGESEEDLSEAESELSSATQSTAAIVPTPVSQPLIRRRQARGARSSRRNGSRFLSRADRERHKLEKAHPEIRTMWDDLANVPLIPAQAAEQPQSITRTLKSFQLEGLNWMTKQEQTQWQGGLLGDEMGMGKTIQAVSLIMSDYPQKDPTLVVVPPVALMQWSSEISEYTDGKLKVLVYHGSNAKSKKMSVKDLRSYDVIMISYSSLESVFRKETKGWSRDDKIVKEDSAIHAIHFHRLILDEAHSIKSRQTGVAKACFGLKGTYKW